TQRFTSTDHTIQLMVRTPFSTLSAYWLQNLFIFVPLSLCLSVPTLFCTPGMRLLATLSGARTVLHIQDYEVDAMLGLGMAGKG
ncbi:hypothetical protein ONO39_27820, partial [Salmonella enterica subsp. enterica serovar Anatum]|nr:hypothetical protein [Salmonella enterica subsp. enterica serovar Anatum]